VASEATRTGRCEDDAVTTYDIIGDIHGCADKLEGLLSKLGYTEHLGAYRQPGRQALFVGDFIDRGTKQVRTVEIVRSMVDAGSARAVMGNHEFNAIAYATEDPDAPGDYARSHQGEAGEKHLGQHGKFLAEAPFDSPMHREIISWFRTLPFFLELPELRVVHACWHRRSIFDLNGLRAEGSPVSDGFICKASTKKTHEHKLIEVVLKGPEISLTKYKLPPFIDTKGGDVPRSEARLRWWKPDATSLRDLAEIPFYSKTQDGSVYPEVPDVPVERDLKYRYPIDERPVFFGHYWKQGDLYLEGRNTVCVDYSAVTPGGALVAYRYEGEPALSAGHLVSFTGGTP
jgi:hypothetical protein